MFSVPPGISTSSKASCSGFRLSAFASKPPCCTMSCFAISVYIRSASASLRTIGSLPSSFLMLGSGSCSAASSQSVGSGSIDRSNSSSTTRPSHRRTETPASFRSSTFWPVSPLPSTSRVISASAVSQPLSATAELSRARSVSAPSASFASAPSSDSSRCWASSDFRLRTTFSGVCLRQPSHCKPRQVCGPPRECRKFLRPSSW
mmetsp:Transcript_51235/g.141806  ORF Transcript_51235/g.141806 Transcript_51235/m.141806 type:complete len:204 (+) Transcript_51235:1040-1651(+)